MLNNICDRSQWNYFISKAEYSNIFQTFEWGKFKESIGWYIRRFLLERDITRKYLVLQANPNDDNQKHRGLGKGRLFFR